MIKITWGSIPLIPYSLFISGRPVTGHMSPNHIDDVFMLFVQQSIKKMARHTLVPYEYYMGVWWAAWAD